MSRVVNPTLPKRIATFGMICAATVAVSACQTLGSSAANKAVLRRCFCIGPAGRGPGGV